MLAKMTKAKTEGQKRRRKGQRGRPKLDGPREPNGRLSRAKGNVEAMIVRARHAGKLGDFVAKAYEAGGDPIKQAELRKRVMVEMGQPWYGCNAGRMIAGEKDVGELWQVILSIRSIREAYLRAISAPSEHAKSVNLAIKSDTPPGADATPPRDFRTEEERATDARRAWSVLRRAMGSDEGYIAVVVGQDKVQPNRLAPVLRRVAKEMGWV